MIEQTSKCPQLMVTADSREWLSIYGHYNSGFLAVSGGYLDQPNAYLEAMRLIDSLANSDDRS